MRALAEGVGFEPTRERKPPGGFQDRCLKPLGHPSRVCQLGNTALRKNQGIFRINRGQLPSKGAAPKDGPAHATPLRNLAQAPSRSRCATRARR
jgi:hypothetical protein